MREPTTTDAVIIGAGPCGLFSVFQLGLAGLRCEVIEARDQPGGQCTEFYPDKPVYDIPALPVVTGADLIARLAEQIRPFSPGFHFGQRAATVRRLGEEGFAVETAAGLSFRSAVVVIAAGGGALTPGPAADWGLDLVGDLIPVDTEAFETVVPGLFAIGDANSYPGKLKLILSGFHEAALMAQKAFLIKNPGARPVVQYTSASTSAQRKLGVS